MFVGWSAYHLTLAVRVVCGTCLACNGLVLRWSRLLRSTYGSGCLCCIWRRVWFAELWAVAASAWAVGGWAMLLPSCRVVSGRISTPLPCTRTWSCCIFGMLGRGCPRSWCRPSPRGRHDRWCLPDWGSRRMTSVAVSTGHAVSLWRVCEVLVRRSLCVLEQRGSLWPRESACVGRSP